MGPKLIPSFIDSMADVTVGEQPSPNPAEALAKANAVAEQIAQLAGSPEVDLTNCNEVMLVVDRAMLQLRARKKAIQEGKAADNASAEEQGDGSDQVPLITGYAPSHTDTDMEENLSNRHRDVVYLAILCLSVLAFMLGFAVLFWWLERDSNWTLIDGWFFAVVTLGTVGYGVLTPSNDWTRGWVVIFLVLGVAIFIFSFSLMTELILSSMEDFTTKHKIHKFTICGPRSLGLFSMLLLIITIGTLYGVTGEDWNFVESLYWTVVTITTVGYGDYAPSTQSGRLAISFFILAGCGAFAAILSGVVASYISIRHRAAALLFMMTALTEEKLSKMPRNSRGEVTRVEFLEYMLIKLGYVPAEDLDLIHSCFDALDVDGGGTLDVTDIVRSNEGKDLLEKMRLEHGITDGDRNMLPFGLFGIRFKFVKEKEKFDVAQAKAILEKAKSKAKAMDDENEDEDKLFHEKATTGIKSLFESFKPDFESPDERKARLLQDTEGQPRKSLAEGDRPDDSESAPGEDTKKVD